jgi:hypothetical protein
MLKGGPERGRPSFLQEVEVSWQLVPSEYLESEAYLEAGRQTP